MSRSQHRLIHALIEQRQVKNCRRKLTIDQQGMLELLRDAMNHGNTVTIACNVTPGKMNGAIIRTWITKPTVTNLPVNHTTL